MAIIMGKGCLEAIYGLMGWKGLRKSDTVKVYEDPYHTMLINYLFKIVLVFKCIQS